MDSLTIAVNCASLAVNMHHEPWEYPEYQIVEISWVKYSAEFVAQRPEPSLWQGVHCQVWEYAGATRIPLGN